jgi:hypothetical protein
MDPAHRFADQRQRRPQAVAAERAWLGVGRGDHELVGDAAHAGALDDEAVPLQHRLAVERQPGLSRRCRWLKAQPGELRVGVRKARSRFAALVDERVDVARNVRRAPLPRLADEL